MFLYYLASCFCSAQPSQAQLADEVSTLSKSLAAAQRESEAHQRESATLLQRLMEVEDAHRPCGGVAHGLRAQVARLERGQSQVR